MEEIDYNLKQKDGAAYLKCNGIWKVNSIAKVEKRLRKIKITSKTLYIDLENVKELDSSGALLIFIVKYNAQNRLFALIEKSFKSEKLPVKRKSVNFIENIGKSVIEIYLYIINFIKFIGELFVKSFKIFIKPKNFRLKETVYFIQSSGINAMPIVAMTSFLVGVVIAYQTIVQLSKFGADIFVVDASAISIARELGPMITAIVVAGRSASSFTAEIGAMKLTEEIDAMKTMGFMPFLLAF